MAEVRFLPFYADTLHQVLHSAIGRGGVQVTVRPDVDPAVVRHQVEAYARSVGVQVICRDDGGRVHVRRVPVTPPRVDRAG